VSAIYTELALVALAAMCSPTTLTFSVLTLVLGKRPLRTGGLFYLGALGATLAVGVVAAFVIGDAAHASEPNSPKTWVAVVDIMAALVLLGLVVRGLRRPANTQRVEAAISRIGAITDSPAIAVIGAGAALANPGGFIPLALKEISELGPSTGEYVLLWVGFALISLLPLSVALVLLALDRTRAERWLGGARGWLERHARTVAAAIVVLLAAALLRNGIAGLSANA